MVGLLSVSTLSLPRLDVSIRAILSVTSLKIYLFKSNIILLLSFISLDLLVTVSASYFILEYAY